MGAIAVALLFARPGGALPKQEPDRSPAQPPGWGARAGLERLIPEAVEYHDKSLQMRERAESIESIGPSHQARKEASLDLARIEARRAISQLRKALPYAEEFADDATMTELRALVDKDAEGDEYVRAKRGIDLVMSL